MARTLEIRLRGGWPFILQGMRCLPLLLLVCLPAMAQDVYRWVDAHGVVHYTNDPKVVPAKEKVEKTRGSALTEMGAPAPKVEPRLRQDEPASSTERSEVYWRDAFTQAHERIRVLELEISEDRRKVEDPSGLPVLGQYGCLAGGAWVGPNDQRYQTCRAYGVNPDFQEAKDRLVREQAALVKAKADLEDLERRASLQSVPREWRR